MMFNVKEKGNATLKFGFQTSSSSIHRGVHLRSHVVDARSSRYNHEIRGMS